MVVLRWSFAAYWFITFEANIFIGIPPANFDVPGIRSRRTELPPTIPLG